MTTEEHSPYHSQDRDWQESYNNTLEAMLKQLWWMARRYADGRSTSAPSTVNEIYDQCQRMGIELGDDNGEKYAKDGYLGDWVPQGNRFLGKKTKDATDW